MKSRLVNVSQEGPLAVPNGVHQFFCQIERTPFCLAFIPEQLGIVLP